MKKLLKITLALSFTTIILLGFTMPLNPPNGTWYQQFMPNIGSRSISDIFFIDSLTGIAISSRSNDTTFILKTTNSGNNWFINRIDSGVTFNRIKFINELTGFIGGYIRIGSQHYILKTTNAGISWFYMNAPFDKIAYDMSVLNENTIWLVDNNSLVGGVFFTSNGGVNWQNQFSSGNQNPNKIYMYNARIGFMSNSSALPNIYKTTNSGVNWILNLPGENFTDMHFTDSLNGWKCTNNINQAGTIRYTTDGGNNWVIQNTIPEVPPFSFSRMYKFSFVNKDTIWGVGGNYSYTGLQSRGIIYKTTNSGLNWGYQLPDSSINVYLYSTIQFINKKHGWAYSLQQGGVHTVNSGDTVTYFTGVQQISIGIPKEYELKQNFPNPFNPVTNIRYRIKNYSNVKLEVFAVTGKLVSTLLDQKQAAGEYQYTFEANNLSSGVYFYKLTVASGKVVFTETKKLILIK